MAKAEREKPQVDGRGKVGNEPKKKLRLVTRQMVERHVKKPSGERQ